MNQPFEKIFTGSRYDLRYSWNNKDLISNSIKQTYEQYGEDVDTRVFERMIAAITSGGRNSPIAIKRDPSIIANICKYYPDMLSIKVVNNILKCISVNQYPQTCIAEIINTGYKFTDAQLVQLNKSGYNIFDYAEKLDYNGFCALFENNTFINEFIAGLADSSYNTPEGKTVIDTKVAKLKGMIDKYNIVLQPDFLIRIVPKVVYTWKYSNDYAVVAMTNVHIIASALEFKGFTKENFLWLIKSYPQIYTIYTNLAVTNNKNNVNAPAPNAQDDIDERRKRAYSFVKYFVDLYDKPVDRDLFMEMMISDIFVAFCTHEFTDYDPAVDIFYILAKLNEKSDRPLNVVNHFLNKGYLMYDDFLMFLTSLGWLGPIHVDPIERAKHPMIVMMEKMPESITPGIIENIYTFCDYSYIDLLTDMKIIPTVEYAQLIIDCKNLNKLIETSAFVDDDVVAFSEQMILSDTPNNNTVTATALDIIKLRLHNSLTHRDKKVYERKNSLELSTIIKFRVKPTRELIEEFLRIGDLRTVVTLLCLSSDYDYIIDFIDDDILIKTGTRSARFWLYNNIITKRVTSLACQNRQYGDIYYVEQDYQNLMKQPVLINIDQIRQTITSTRESNRRTAIAQAITNDNDSMISKKKDSDEEESESDDDSDTDSDLVDAVPKVPVKSPRRAVY